VPHGNLEPQLLLPKPQSYSFQDNWLMNSHERAQLHDHKNSLSLSLFDPSNHDISTIANMLGANQPCVDSIPISHRLENVASSLQDLPICMYKESTTAMNPLCFVRVHIRPGLCNFSRGSNKCLCV
jgi:hypothetical protein